MKFINENISTCSVAAYINRQTTMNMFCEAKEKFQRASVTVKEYLADPEKYDKEYANSSVYVEEDKGSKKTPGRIFYISPSFTKAYMEGVTTLIDALSNAEFGDAPVGFSVVLACLDGFIEISFAHHTDSCQEGDDVDIVNKNAKYHKYLHLFYYNGVHVLTDSKNIKKLAKDNASSFSLATGYPEGYGDKNCVCKLILKKGSRTRLGDKSDTEYVSLNSIKSEDFAMKAFKAVISEIGSSDKCKKVKETIEDLSQRGIDNANAIADEKAELKSGNVKQPFNSKEELMEIIDEIGKSKTVMKEFEGKSAKIWEKISKAEMQIAKELEKSGLSISDDYEAWKAKEAELEKKYGIDELRKQDDALSEDPKYKESTDKIYTKCRKRLEDSLSKAELKKIGKRGGYMYNLMAAVIQKYSGWDPRK